MKRGALYILTLPERALRALVGTVAGTAQESAALLLPRFVRRSRLYEVTARNALRIAIELVGGVESAKEASVEAAPESAQPSAGRVAVKKAAGNVVEFGSIAAFGFSPLWLLAGAADILNGSRVYLRTLERELADAGLLAEGATFGSVDQLLAAIEGTTGTTASAMDMPPLELKELRTSLTELRQNVTSLPTPAEMAALLDGMRRTATQEDRTLLEVSSGIGLAFLTAGKAVTRDHLVVPYREDWAPVRNEGFGAYAGRIARPYRDAVSGHFDPHRQTFSERLAARAAKRLGWRPWRRRRPPAHAKSR